MVNKAITDMRMISVKMAVFIVLLIPSSSAFVLEQMTTSVRYSRFSGPASINPTISKPILQWNFPADSESDEHSENSSDINIQNIQDPTIILEFVLPTYDTENSTESRETYSSFPDNSNGGKEDLEDINKNLSFLSRSGFPSHEAPQNRPKNQLLWYWRSNGQTITKQPARTNQSNLKPQEPLALECSSVQTEYNGQCHSVLQQKPCSDGQWLIEDLLTMKGKCVENKCAVNVDTAFFEGKCIKIRSEEVCPSGMRTYISKSGEVDCDCKDGFIYNDEDGRCYESFRQGPCPKNQYFGFPKSHRGQISSPKPSCIPNPCFFDGFYCNATSCPSKKRINSWSRYTIENLPKNCLKFGSACTNDGKGLLVIRPDTNRPFCQDDIADFHLPGRIIGNVPTLKCAPGSRRDILGNCRTPAIIEFS